MFWVKIADVQKATLQETGEDFLDVTFEIQDKRGGKVVASHKAAFPVLVKGKEIEAYGANYLKSYTTELEQAAANAENEKINKHVGDLQKELVGSEINEETANNKRK